MCVRRVVAGRRRYGRAVAIGPMVPLTTAANPFAARVLAAHLGAEGIVWELRGNVDGPYPVGPVTILVSRDDLSLAREVVAEPVVDRDPDAADRAGGTTDRHTTRQLWLVVGGVLLAAAILLGRLLVLAGH
jgi:hypothetical protein